MPSDRKPSGGAAFGIYPKQRAKPSSAATKEAAAKDIPELFSDFLIPKDAVDVGLMLVPGGGALRKIGAGLIAGGAATEAEAGMGALRKFLKGSAVKEPVYRGTDAGEMRSNSSYTHFSRNPGVASTYAGYLPEDTLRAAGMTLRDLPIKEGAAVFPAHVNIRRPATPKDVQRAAPNAKTVQESFPALRGAGFDGYVDDYQVVPFTDEQIRSLFEQGYAGGGAVKKGVDLARRSLFGLKPTQAMAGRELAPIQQQLDRMQAELARAEKSTGKAAPKVEERSVTIDPGKGSAKVSETLRKVADTPVSRRTMLKSATGQVMQNMLPMGDLPIPSVSKAVEAAASTALPSTAPGLLALALKKGMGVDEAVDFVRTVMGKDIYDVESVASHMKDPSSMVLEDAAPAAEVLRQMLRLEGESGPMSMRGPLREIKNVDPSRYDEILRTARDVSEYGFTD